MLSAIVFKKIGKSRLFFASISTHCAIACSPSAPNSGGRSAACRHFGKFEQLKNGRRVFPREVTRTTSGLLHFSHLSSVAIGLNFRSGGPSLFSFIVYVHFLSA